MCFVLNALKRRNSWPPDVSSGCFEWLHVAETPSGKNVVLTWKKDNIWEAITVLHFLPVIIHFRSKLFMLIDNFECLTLLFMPEIVLKSINLFNSTNLLIYICIKQKLFFWHFYFVCIGLYKIWNSWCYAIEWDDRMRTLARHAAVYLTLNFVESHLYFPGCFSLLSVRVYQKVLNKILSWILSIQGPGVHIFHFWSRMGSVLIAHLGATVSVSLESL